MSEAELWELLGVWNAYAADMVMYYVTILFAFLLMSYYAGEKLSRFQVAVASGLFLWSSLVTGYGAIGAFWRSLYFREEILKLNPDLSMFLNAEMVIAVCAMLVCGIFVGFAFLFQTRNDRD